MIAPTSSPGAAARTPAALRAPLTLLRLPLLLWHVLVHLPIVLLLLMPFTRHWRWRGEPFQHRVIRASASGG